MLTAAGVLRVPSLSPAGVTATASGLHGKCFKVSVSELCLRPLDLPCVSWPIHQYHLSLSVTHIAWLTCSFSEGVSAVHSETEAGNAHDHTHCTQFLPGWPPTPSLGSVPSGSPVTSAQGPFSDSFLHSDSFVALPLPSRHPLATCFRISLSPSPLPPPPFLLSLFLLFLIYFLLRFFFSFFSICLSNFQSLCCIFPWVLMDTYNFLAPQDCVLWCLHPEAPSVWTFPVNPFLLTNQ